MPDMSAVCIPIPTPRNMPVHASRRAGMRDTADRCTPLYLAFAVARVGTGSPGDGGAVHTSTALLRVSKRLQRAHGFITDRGAVPAVACAPVAAAPLPAPDAP